MRTKADSSTEIQFLEANLIVNRIQPNPSYLIEHNTTLSKGGLARYNLTIVETQDFHFFSRTKIIDYWERRPRRADETSTVHND